MKINLAPKGKNIGYKPKNPKAADGEFDDLTVDAIEMLRKSNAMETSTEDAMKKIEKLRKDTIKQAEK